MELPQTSRPRTIRPSAGRFSKDAVPVCSQDSAAEPSTLRRVSATWQPFLNELSNVQPAEMRAEPTRTTFRSGLDFRRIRRLDLTPIIRICRNEFDGIPSSGNKFQRISSLQPGSSDLNSGQSQTDDKSFPGSLLWQSFVTSRKSKHRFHAVGIGDSGRLFKKNGSLYTRQRV